MSNTVPTAMAAVLASAQYFGIPLKKFPNSTLNQKLSIKPDEVLLSDEIPKIQYVVAGTGGLSVSVDNDNLIFNSKVHEATDTAPFKMRPFVLRTLDTDLTAEERKNYRLRRLEEHNGVMYVGYYARVLDLSEATTVLEKRTVVDGVTTTVPWEPTLENLNPVPSDITTSGAQATTGTYIVATTKVKFKMTANEVQEFINAMKIITGVENTACISELVTVSGIDRVVNGEFNGVNQAYEEVIYAQCANFISAGFVMKYQTDGLAMTLDVGNVEPLLRT